MQISHDDYRAVKRMNRIQMSAYLERIYRRGYEAGVNAMTTKAKKPDDTQDTSAVSSEPEK